MLFFVHISSIHSKFKIDLIVWKRIKERRVERNKRKFKIDLIVWKQKMGKSYLEAPARV